MSGYCVWLILKTSSESGKEFDSIQKVHGDVGTVSIKIDDQLSAAVTCKIRSRLT